MSAHTPEPWGVNTFATPKYVIVPRADYDRARACVNACAGINPEAVPDLLAAAEGIIENWERNLSQPVKVLAAAIAKAKL